MNYQDCKNCLYGGCKTLDTPCEWCKPSKDGGTEYEKK